MKLSILLLAPLLSAPGFAATILCPGSPATAVTVSTLSTGDASSGCAAGTTILSNFTITSGPENNAPAPDPGDVTVYAFGAGSGVDIVFSAAGPGPTWVVPPGTTTLDSLIGFTANSDTTNLFNMLDAALYIGPDNQSGGELTLSGNYCLGETTLAGCPAGQSGGFTETQNGEMISTASASLVPLYNLITVQLDIRIRNQTTQPFGLTELPVDLGEVDPPANPVPEPSLYGLIGIALLLIGIVSGRGRRGARAR